MTRTVTAVFDSFYSAKKAFQELRYNGYPRDLIIIAEQATYGTPVSPLEVKKNARLRSEIISGDVSTGASIGAGIGAALGLAGCTLIGFGTLQLPVLLSIANVFPGIHPLVVALLTCLAAGSLSGGILGALFGGAIGLGISEEEAQQYARNARRGGVIIAVLSDWYTVDQTKEILTHHNPLDLREEVQQPLQANDKKPGRASQSNYQQSHEQDQRR